MPMLHLPAIGNIGYCDRTTQAQILTASVDIHEQCAGVASDSNLLFSIKTADMASGGLAETIEEAYKDIMNAASTKATGHTREGYDIRFTVALQKNASTLRVHELISGQTRVPDPDPDNASGFYVDFADRSGDAVKSYIVSVKVMAGKTWVHTSWFPNCEIKSSSKTAYSTGENHNITLDFMAMPDNSTDELLRMRRHFPAPV